MASLDELKMDADERRWWMRVRARGALWFVVNKGLLFLCLYPAAGCGLLGWPWSTSLLVEAWLLGLVAGSLVWMRKELRFRFTLDQEGLALPDPHDE